MSLKIFLAVSREPDLKSVNNLFAVEIRSGILCTALKRIEEILLGLFAKERNLFNCSWKSGNHNAYPHVIDLVNGIQAKLTSYILA